METPSASGTSSALLFREALAGESAALGALLQQLRPWLRVLAEGMVGPHLAPRFDSSDIIQQTCLSVHNRLGDFRGNDVRQFMAWIREIHRRNLQNELRRHLGTEARDVERETPLDDVDSGQFALDCPPGRQIFLSEDSLLVAGAMEDLPASQRTAVRLRYLEDLPVTRIGELMGVTPDAVTSLIRRGILALRSRLPAE